MNLLQRIAALERTRSSRRLSRLFVVSIVGKSDADVVGYRLGDEIMERRPDEAVAEMRGRMEVGLGPGVHIARTNYADPLT